jgi:TRAP-type mannitol/chloroaromatic compound transport system permease small subunit
MVDSISYIVFFFPSLVMLLAASGSEAWSAYVIGETSEQTTWRPILWPYKSVVPATCVLLMIQGVSETIKSVYAWRMGIVLEHKEKIEI